jgi:hypothetical protein
MALYLRRYSSAWEGIEPEGRPGVFEILAGPHDTSINNENKMGKYLRENLIFSVLTKIDIM